MQMIYALSFLIVCCVIQDAVSLSPDWKLTVKTTHKKKIDKTVNKCLTPIQKLAKEKGNTPAAKKCYEQAEKELKHYATLSGYARVETCVYSSKDAKSANSCCDLVNATIGAKSIEVTKKASKCFQNIK